MKWTKVGNFNIDRELIKLPFTFSALVAVKAKNIRNIRPNWKWAGYLYELIETPLGLTRIEQRLSIPIEIPIVFQPSRLAQNFKLEFEKQEWIEQLTLEIYQSNTMSIYSDPNITIPSGNSSSTTATTVPNSATSVSLLAANANRKSFTITNNSNQDLFIEFGATASIVAFAIRLPKLPGSNIPAVYEGDEYTGAIAGIWQTAGTGGALVREFI
jgi:hypothetical protein